jgi:hypothetical protein
MDFDDVCLGRLLSFCFPNGPDRIECSTCSRVPPQAKLTERQAAARPPNILFVLADQWRYEAFGYAGNLDVKTPKNLPKYSRLQGRLDATLNRKLEERHDNFLPGDAYIKQWGYKVDTNGTAPYKP